MSILVLAHDSDAVADHVGAELRSRGVTVARVNPSSFPTRMSMAAFLYGSGTWSGLLNGEDGQEIELEGIRAVWRRRPSQFAMDERMSAPERAFAYGEARRGFGGVLASLGECLWVNDPMAAARAEYKPVQLAAAAHLGMTLPETLITSEPRSAYEWAKGLGKPIIYKPLSGVWHADEGQLRVMFTSPVTDLESLRDPALGRTAQLFQEHVPEEFAVRATVIGDRVFAVRIDVDTGAAPTDWRSDYDALTYSVIELPDPLASALVQLHRRLGLAYGAADLIYDTSGRWVFLETNQSGEFGWLVDETGLPLISAVADLLEKGV